jgi:hypothetical protein
MSETEHWKGKLVSTGKTVSEFVSTDEIPPHYESDEEYFEEKYYRAAHVISGIVYEIEMEEMNSDGDIATAVDNNDGSIDFEVRYYNGGASFTEMIEEATDNL